MSRLAWHFVCSVNGVPTLRDGRPVPPVGEWLVHEGDVEICVSGLHASDRALDALKYCDWPDAVACLVEVDDVVTEQSDKLVCRRRMVVGMCDADEVLWVFAREQALSVAHLWQMPDVVRRYLETGDPGLRAAAWYAAGVSAGAAAGAAAWYAAGASAMAAAGAAAWYAARDLLESLLLTEMGL